MSTKELEQELELTRRQAAQFQDDAIMWKTAWIELKQAIPMKILEDWSGNGYAAWWGPLLDAMQGPKRSIEP